MLNQVKWALRGNNEKMDAREFLRDDSIIIHRSYSSSSTSSKLIIYKPLIITQSKLCYIKIKQNSNL